MKKILLITTLAAFFAACSSSTENLPSVALGESTVQDTTGLAAFEQWKNQQPIVAEQTQELESNLIAKDPPKTKIIYRDKPTSNTAKRKKIEAPESNPEPGIVTDKQETYGTPAVKSRKAISRVGSGVGGDSGEIGNEGVGTNEEPSIENAPVENLPKKEGWSKAAKGTAIGAASGAVLGAIVSKKKGTGAIIGGAIGALGGYVIGRSKDKKDGRY